jgi:hypothetical protein
VTPATTLALLTIYEEGPADPETSGALALEAGYTLEELAAARRKVHREVVRAVEDEEQAERAADERARGGRP